MSCDETLHVDNLHFLIECTFVMVMKSSHVENPHFADCFHKKDIYAWYGFLCHVSIDTFSDKIFTIWQKKKKTHILWYHITFIVQLSENFLHHCIITYLLFLYIFLSTSSKIVAESHTLT